ncbi:MAG: DegV family protein [Anaerolineae bacterium]
MIQIVTDSGANLPLHVREQYHLIVVPLYVIFGAKSYRDEIDLNNDEFHYKLHHEKVHPTTSTPAPADFIHAWRPVLEAGNEIVSLHISGKLSATFATAQNAKKQIDAEFGGNAPITLVDSNSVSMAMGLQAIEGARAVRAGKSREEVAAAMLALNSRMRLVFLLDTLEYLRRGGRIGHAQAFIGGVFSIKPLLQIADGLVEPLERSRSMKAGMARLIDLINNPPAIHGVAPKGNGAIHATVLHAAYPEGADYLENEVRARFNVAEFYKGTIGPVIAVHTGPKAVGLAFYRD